ncbi:MAG: ATP-dependent sacrificial sulfur transferase LarE [Oscillospiraceae bacterium]|nr:ATP-dependent sacrificial sulfur transferase LarE [Oscillospiraceae bacterium]
MELRDFFAENPSAALAFSGGVDSSYLLYAAMKYGKDIKAYYINTAFQPAFELKDAIDVAAHVGANMMVVELDVLKDNKLMENTPERCYFCKYVIFNTMIKLAAADGYKLVIDGTNASDDAGDRAGMRALNELMVRSPLRECGLTKDMIRKLSREAGLPTWNKPAYACLATRIPSGRSISAELLEKVEKAEDAMFALGFTDFRVRVEGDAARLQLPLPQMPAALEKRDAILGGLKQYFPVVLLDMETR